VIRSRGFLLNSLSLLLVAVASVLNAFAAGRIGATEATIAGTLAVAVVALGTAPRPVQALRQALDPLVLGAGALEGLAALLFFEGLAQLGPVPLALLGALSPVFATLLAVIVLGERLTRRQAAAGLAAVAGALLFSWREGAPPATAGLALAAASMLAYAGSSLLSALSLRARSPAELLPGIKLGALVACLAAGLVGGRLGAGPSEPGALALVVVAALLGGLVGHRLFLEALRHDGLATSSAVRAAGPVATAAVAWPFFPLALTPVNLAGGAVLLAAAAWLGAAGAAKDGPRSAAPSPRRRTPAGRATSS
jgi:drug/metabolite transporter (DMT)-like permease